MQQHAISIFCSYAHEDEELKNKLLSHLSNLKRQNLISEWNDRAILPGQEWESEINDKIRTADLILILVSSDFIESDYCYEEELSIALERHDSNLAVVLPIILRPCDWKQAPFAKILALPKDGNPITKWADQDDACLNVVEGIKKTIQEINKLKNRTGEGAGLLSMHNVLSKEIDRLDKILNEDEQKSCSGLSTGLSDLDEITDGIHSSEMIIIASRPSMGKTALALNIASHIAINEKQSVAYLSMNTTAEATTRRLISSIGHIDYGDVLRCRLRDEDWPRMTAAISLLNEAPLFIDESALTSISGLRNKLIEFKKKNDLKLVVIDSLQDLSYNEAHSSGVIQPDVAYKLKQLSLELQLPIILTVYLPRTVESRVNKRPLLSDLSEFEKLHNYSDVIIFLYKEDLYEDYESIDYSNVELIIAKNNNGQLGTIKSIFNSKYSVFHSFKHTTDNEID